MCFFFTHCISFWLLSKLHLAQNLHFRVKLEYCAGVDQAKKAIRAGRKVMRPLTQMGLNRCKRPCTMKGYEIVSPLISNKVDPYGEINSYIYVNLITNDTIIEEELHIFDVNSITGTIGGALGLFIGFSFLTCAMDIFDAFEDALLKN